MSFPKNFYCPITYQLMTDPVIDNEGHSYERSAILESLKLKKWSPITKEPLMESDLRSNITLKDAIIAKKKELERQK